MRPCSRAARARCRCVARRAHGAPADPDTPVNASRLQAVWRRQRHKARAMLRRDPSGCDEAARRRDQLCGRAVPPHVQIHALRQDGRRERGASKRPVRPERCGIDPRAGAAADDANRRQAARVLARVHARHVVGTTAGPRDGGAPGTRISQARRDVVIELRRVTGDDGRPRLRRRLVPVLAARELLDDRILARLLRRVGTRRPEAGRGSSWRQVRRAIGAGVRFAVERSLLPQRRGRRRSATIDR
jgi:hypothetical protein